MGRATWLLDVVSDAFRGVHGFRVDYMPGWNTRGKDNFAPRGVINHHTGRGTYNALLNYMTYSAQYAPLCNIATSRPEGGVVRVTVVAAGKANHAGRGHLPWTGTDMGNVYSVGFENQNDGGQSWPAQQNEAIARANLAVLNHLKVGVDRLADHKTYAPTRKVDRVHVDVEFWRTYVQNIGGAVQMIAGKGSRGKVVERIQRDVNVLLTWKKLGPTKMSTNPRDGVGINVDGDYGPATASAVKETCKLLADVDVAGDSFGALEAYLFLRYGYYADDQRHLTMDNHGGTSKDVDLSAYAKRTEVNALKSTFNEHKHGTGAPREKA